MGLVLVLDGVGGLAGVQRKVRADGVLPGWRQQRREQGAYEQGAEQDGDRAGAGADDDGETESEQPEDA